MENNVKISNLNRLREIDFLRGIAIVLVLLRHQPLSLYTTNLGWIGVDLFFVLSGFLVSGLLFKEYLRFGNIKPLHFLIRRGFKIYPVYFITYPLYLIFILNEANLSFFGIISDLFFFQNYFSGWGYAYQASWSLAVEEHFYIGLCILLWFLFRKKSDEGTTNFDRTNHHVLVWIISMMIFCFVIRLVTVYLSNDDIRNFSMSHLRMDSLLTGVCIAFFYYFKIDDLKNIYYSKKHFLWIIALISISWTPFIDPLPSIFVKTIGFCCLYYSFGVLLLTFLLTPNINNYLNKIFSCKVVDCVSRIGFCSYSIYIIHSFVIIAWERHFPKEYQNLGMNIVLTSTLSVLLGMIITYSIENYFIKIRNQVYPSRSY